MSREATRQDRPPRPEERFAEWLSELERRGDRARLAAIRRGAGRRIGEAPEVDRVVLSALPPGISGWAIDDYWLLATLFALAPSEQTGGPPLTTALRRLAAKDESARPGLERRLQAALAAPREDLQDHLQALVRLAGGADLAWDWSRLLRDIRSWDHPERFVQRRWAIGFWGPREEATDNATSED